MEVSGGQTAVLHHGRRRLRGRLLLQVHSLLHSLLHSGVEKITLDFKDIIGNTDELIEEITEMAFGDARYFR